MMKGKTILPLFVLTSLLSGCITTRLSDKIEKSEGNSIFAVDSLYAISPNSGGAEKGNQLTLRGNKYSYRITSGAEAFSAFLEKQNARQALNNDQISVNVEFSTFQIDGSNKFSGNGPLEISYAFREGQLADTEIQALHQQGFRLERGNDFPTLSYPLQHVVGVLEKPAESGDEIGFWPVKIKLEKEGASFSALRLLYPFTVIADVATSPFQLVGYLLVQRSLPAMKY